MNLEEAYSRLVFLSRPHARGLPNVYARDREALQIVIEVLERYGEKMPDVEPAWGDDDRQSPTTRKGEA